MDQFILLNRYFVTLENFIAEVTRRGLDHSIVHKKTVVTWTPTDQYNRDDKQCYSIVTTTIKSIENAFPAMIQWHPKATNEDLIPCHTDY